MVIARALLSAAKKVKKEKKKEKKKEEELKVEPTPAPKKEEPKAKPSKEEVKRIFTSVKTGRPSGVEFGGRTYLGLSPEEVTSIAGAESIKIPTAEERAAPRQKAELIAKTKLAEEKRNLALQPKAQPIIPEQPITDITQEGMIAGGVTPITAEDVFTVATIGVGGAGFKIASKIPKGAKLALPITKRAAASAAAKTAVSLSFKSIAKKIGAKGIAIGASSVFAVIGVGKLIGLPKKKAQNIDSAQSQIREAITAPLQAVAWNAMTPLEGIEELQFYEDQIDDYGRQLQEMRLVGLTELDRQTLDAAKLRNRKIKTFLNNAQFFLQTAVQSGEEPNPEQIAILLQQLKDLENSID